MSRRREIELYEGEIALLIDDSIYEIKMGESIPRRLVFIASVNSTEDDDGDGKETAYSTCVVYTRDTGVVTILPPPETWDAATEEEFIRKFLRTERTWHPQPFQDGAIKGIVSRHRPDLVADWEVVEAEIAALDDYEEEDYEEEPDRDVA